jgi:hypothetical protein
LQFTVPGIVEVVPGQSGGQGPTAKPFGFSQKTKSKIKRFAINRFLFAICGPYIFSLLLAVSVPILAKHVKMPFGAPSP